LTKLRLITDNEKDLEVIYDKDKGIDNVWEILRADADVEASVIVLKNCLLDFRFNAIVSTIDFFIVLY